jgi:hypothetical protein
VGVEADAGERDRDPGGAVEAEGVERLGVDPGLGGFEGDEAAPAMAGGAEKSAADHRLPHAGIGAGDEEAG